MSTSSSETHMVQTESVCFSTTFKLKRPAAVGTSNRPWKCNDFKTSGVWRLKTKQCTLTLQTLVELHQSILFLSFLSWSDLPCGSKPPGSDLLLHSKHKCLGFNQRRLKEAGGGGGGGGGRATGVMHSGSRMEVWFINKRGDKETGGGASERFTLSPFHPPRVAAALTATSSFLPPSLRFPFPSTLLLTPGVPLNHWPTLTTLRCNYRSHRPPGGSGYVSPTALFLVFLPPPPPPSSSSLSSLCSFFAVCSSSKKKKMPLNVCNLCVSKSRWVTAGKKKWQRTHSEFDSAIKNRLSDGGKKNKNKNRERMSGWLQTMPRFWRAFGWCSNPVSAGIGPARSTSQNYTLPRLLLVEKHQCHPPPPPPHPPPPPPNPPSLQRQQEHFSFFFFSPGNQSGFLADPEVLAERGRKKKIQLCNSSHNRETLSLRHAKV